MQQRAEARLGDEGLDAVEHEQRLLVLQRLVRVGVRVRGRGRVRGRVRVRVRVRVQARVGVGFRARVG